MFALMLPWLIIAVLIGGVIGLVGGFFLASSLTRKHYSHFQEIHTQPIQRGFPRPVSRYLDENEVYARPRH
ncbi:hypothetical protein KDW_10410 [Dictyobacter vulcani]|uniref:Uncharacterized protein n=1 Tax=Dictyobacter vulcani TaxID=2607529 RepID=A0A5J4KL32_9CHLR|nr:hypothetical protein [Dictyobacter vulcani]GER86879.1 hypothetical protein KDW_10410 [Dictyobacter vulcani]